MTVTHLRAAAALLFVLATLAGRAEPLDVLVTVGSYRSVSYALNSAGVQLDDNMADFRFPPELR